MLQEKRNDFQLNRDKSHLTRCELDAGDSAPISGSFLRLGFFCSYVLSMSTPPPVP